MKIVTVVGARPQFIKAAMVSHVLRKKHDEVLIHTGQHYDYNMSETFFKELDIPTPDYNLGISGGTHAEMTGRMMISIEKILVKEKTDWLLVYGDTNSTLAAALAAAKLHIPICHVEAGGRTHSRTNPEEINRICTDHISSLLLASSASGMEEMRKENIGDHAILVGDPMYDAFVKYSRQLSMEDIRLKMLSGDTCRLPDAFYYLTCHREENTNRDDDLREILMAMEELESKVIYPVHPRNQARVKKISSQIKLQNTIFTEPIGYLESMCLVRNAKKIITDSGGLQREAFFAGKKCVTLLDFVVWPETMIDNRNNLSRPIKQDILMALALEQKVDISYKPFGDGYAAEKILNALERSSVVKVI